jgi:hypothetical protein
LHASLVKIKNQVVQNCLFHADIITLHLLKQRNVWTSCMIEEKLRGIKIC